MNFVQLLAAARLGNQDAVGRLLAEYRNLLLRLANEQLNGNGRAEFGASDVVQAAHIRALNSIADFRGSTEQEFRTWLVTILHNELQRMRKFFTAEKRGGGVVRMSIDDSDAPRIADSTSSPTEAAIRNEQQAKLCVALQLLPADYLRVIDLRDFQKLPFRDVGRQMGRSADACEKLWVRAIQELRRLMGRQS